MADEFRVDIERNRLEFRGHVVDLTCTQADLLSFFAAKPGRVFHRDALSAAIYGLTGAERIGEKTVDVFVFQLRKKIAAVPGVRINCIRGRGYVLDIEKVA